VLCEMKNYECEENQRGLELWQSLYTNDGLKSTWKATYTEWLNELAEMNDIPPGIFRNFWIQDALGQSDEDLELIDRWFKPEEEVAKCWWCNARGVDTKTETGVWIHAACG